MVRFAPFAGLPRPWRWAARLLTVVLVLAVVAAGLVIHTVRRSFPQLAGELPLPGLTAAVTVHRDRYGVPHVYADTPEDLFRAQGYVHAQDRFWEMDFRRKTTAGRLSELFGTATLDVDKVVRTLGWRRTAEQELPLLRPETRRYLEAYAAGVNAWLDRHPGAAERSLEYAVLALTGGGHTPEPWTPADSLAWLKAMAWDLRSNLDSELERAVAATAVPVDRVETLYPAYPYDRHRPIVTGDAPAEERSGPAVTGSAAGALTRVARTLAAVPGLLAGSGERSGVGSNSWVVSGAHTATGRPLLANDPHLSATMPAIWYQAGLHCRRVSAACPFDVVGYTFSGLPGVVIGHNARVAWGFTNLGPDVADLYLERVKGETYEAGGEWLPLETRVEEIKVAGGPSVRLPVRETRHGPIISEVYQDAADALPGAAAAAGEPGDGLQVALRWTALDPGRTADAIFLMNTAGNWAEFRRAAAAFEVPSQNLVYADVDGNIGYQAPGRIPVRAKGDGRWPVPGWTGEYEWEGFVRFDDLPRVYNPPEGVIVTANHAVTVKGAGPYLADDWAYGYRARRIADRLAEAVAKGGVTAAAMAELQLDSRHGLAPVLVPYLLKAPGTPAEARRLLERWDHGQEADSAGAAYFNAVWRRLLALTFHDQLPEAAWPKGGDRWFEVVRGLLERPEDAWWDDARTKETVESRDAVLRQAMTEAYAELRERLGDDPAGWRWGDLHTLELTHQSLGASGIAPIEWLFNRGPYPLAGGKDAVNATGWDARKGYQVNTVPSMRMVVDLADFDASRWVNLTGASGHAFHANYADQAELWATGRTVPMRYTEAAVRAAATDTLTLVPGPGGGSAG